MSICVQEKFGGTGSFFFYVCGIEISLIFS